MDALELSQALKAAAIPIEGCSVPSDDRSTWRVDFSASASASHRQQAADLITAYTPLTDTQKIDAEAQLQVGDKKLQAVALALWECIPTPTMTKAQFKARAVAIFKTL